MSMSCDGPGCGRPATAVGSICDAPLGLHQQGSAGDDKVQIPRLATLALSRGCGAAGLGGCDTPAVIPSAVEGSALAVIPSEAEDVNAMESGGRAHRPILAAVG